MTTRIVILALTFSVAGCASVHTKGTLGEEAPACVVKQPGLLGSRVVHVRHREARVPGLLMDQIIASIDGAGDVHSHTGVGKSKAGRLQGKVLEVSWVGKPLVTDPIDNGKVRLKGMLGGTTYEYAPGCSVEDAAVGAYALFRVQNDETFAAAAEMD